MIQQEHDGDTDPRQPRTGAGITYWDASAETVYAVATDQPFPVAIISGGGGGGGGTEYTEGDTDATITGSAIMWEDTSDTLRSVSAAKPLPVNVVAGGTSGGATEAKQDTQITEQADQGTTLDGILSDLQLKADKTENQPVSATSLPLPTGASTSTLQNTTNSNIGATSVAAATVGSTGSVSAKLRLMTTQLNAIQTAVETIDNIVSGSEAQVDVVSTPASSASVYVGTLAYDDWVAATDWEELITNSGPSQAKKIIIKNWTDKVIEIAYEATPTDTAGVDIYDYVTPWTVYELDLKASELYIDTDVWIRWPTEPTLGDVYGTIYY